MADHIVGTLQSSFLQRNVALPKHRMLKGHKRSLPASTLKALQIENTGIVCSRMLIHLNLADCLQITLYADLQAKINAIFSQKKPASAGKSTG